MLGVSFPSNVQGGAPAAKAFLYILRQRNVSGSNHFGCFSANQNVHLKFLNQNEPYYIMRGDLVMQWGSCVRKVHAWRKNVSLGAAAPRVPRIGTSESCKKAKIKTGSRIST